MQKPNTKITGWMSGNPKHIGEYEASFGKIPNLRRWWNGHNWSECYFDYALDEYKKSMRRDLIESEHTETMYYRGLMKKPTNPPEYYLKPLE